MRVFYTASFKVKLHLAKQGNPPDNHPSQSSFLKINLVFKVKKVRLGADSGNVNTQVFRARFRYRQEFPMPAAQRQRKPMPVIPKVEERRGLPFFPNRNLYTFLYLFFFFGRWLPPKSFRCPTSTAWERGKLVRRNGRAGGGCTAGSTAFWNKLWFALTRGVSFCRVPLHCHKN